MDSSERYDGDHCGDDDKLFLWNGGEKASFVAWKIIDSSNFINGHYTIKTWTIVESEFSLFWMKLCSISDNRGIVAPLTLLHFVIYF